MRRNKDSHNSHSKCNELFESLHRERLLGESPIFHPFIHFVYRGRGGIKSLSQTDRGQTLDRSSSRFIISNNQK